MEEFSHISQKEYPLLVQALIEGKERDEIDANEVMKDLQFIERSFALMKSQSLMRRRSAKLKQQLEALLHQRVTGEIPVWDSRSKKYTFLKNK